MTEALIGIVAILLFVLVLWYLDHRRQKRQKHAH
jgi:hypothetical protein